VDRKSVRVKLAAKGLQFELAAILRDEIRELKKK
jgi:protein-arginine kinase activator protein McsA